MGGLVVRVLGGLKCCLLVDNRGSMKKNVPFLPPFPPRPTSICNNFMKYLLQESTEGSSYCIDIDTLNFLTEITHELFCLKEQAWCQIPVFLQSRTGSGPGVKLTLDSKPAPAWEKWRSPSQRGGRSPQAGMLRAAWKGGNCCPRVNSLCPPPLL